ncbi:CGNR zinc finger domain-containing protein [Brevibacillus migulae]|uniref:CGNR zinc finger domain-containing protein n=1 Tax=Brevibacillus migulae TaxID=1644114 RepID=UPI00106E0273|nr:ABATE domain-containing protein [Brevibacillus migulae]
MDFLFMDFLNSDWRDWRGTGRSEDRLDRQGWLESFCARWKLEAPLPIDAEARKRLGELREAMRRMIEDLVHDVGYEPADLAVVNQALALAPSHPQLVKGEAVGFHLEQISSVPGWPLVTSQIAASFADFLVHEDIRRLKICDNQDCCWIFYDESRNRVRRWCEDKTCGNLMKVRRFRERQKTRAAAAEDEGKKGK